MLESTVSVLPSDWFSLSLWPRFQYMHCNRVAVLKGFCKYMKEND